MRIAIEGCAHGELQVIYETIQTIQQRSGQLVDLLICCGDFQSTRNGSDLRCMACPVKYQHMCSFWRYYSGELKAPILTLFIGGNHEASNFLQELPYGGWVAPNIYYLGYAGVVKFRGVRIGGLSGIYKGHDYFKGHFEAPPYGEDTKRSVYHVRNLEVFRLKQLVGNPPDIMLSHDWPRNVYKYGDVEKLLQWKPFFRSDIENDALGSRPGEELLDTLQPKYWFSGHLHVKFPAVIEHPPRKGSDGQEERRTTRFLALDKCLPRKQFLQIVEIPDDPKAGEFEYDLDWLAVLRSTDHLLSVSETANYMPGPGYNGRWDYRPTKEELAEVDEILAGDYSIPTNFVVTGPVATGTEETATFEPASAIAINPQTVEFCKLFNVTDPLAKLSTVLRQQPGEVFETPEATNDEEEEEEVAGPWLEEEANVTLAGASVLSVNPDEIDLDDDDDEDGDVDGNRRLSDGGRKFSLPKPKNTEGEAEFVEDDDFVIDPRPSISSLLASLPAPKYNVDDSVADSPVYDPTCGVETASGAEINSPQLKKFKRRNTTGYSEEI